MTAARRSGYTWPNTCGGKAKCGVCVFVIAKDRDICLSPVGESERVRLAVLARYDQTIDDVRRLACQALVLDDVRIWKRGVRKLLH
jgi:ferredoxin